MLAFYTRFDWSLMVHKSNHTKDLKTVHRVSLPQNFEKMNGNLTHIATSRSACSSVVDCVCKAMWLKGYIKAFGAALFT